MRDKFKTWLSLLMMMNLVVLCGFINSGDIITKGSGEVKGRLLIAGGALQSGNKEVFETFIHMAGGREKSYIGIISTASSDPIKSAEDFKDELVKIYGVPEKNVEFIPMYYDDVSKGLKSNVSEEECVKIIKHCTGLWFTGGDQRRLVGSLYKKDNTNTRVLDEIYKIYKKGVVIAGTSAGAAIMSSIMITGGNSRDALMNTEIWNFKDLPHGDSLTLSIGRGLGLFEYGIVDQHFGERDRLGRLITVCSRVKNGGVGFGIDENTAMVVSEDSGLIEVVGEGGVTVVDTRAAVLEPINKKLNINNVRISYISAGGVFNAKAKKMIISGEREKFIYTYGANDSVIDELESSSNALKKFILENLKISTGVDRVEFPLSLGNKYDCKFIIKKDAITNLSNLENCSGFIAENIKVDIKFND